MTQFTRSLRFCLLVLLSLPFTAAHAQLRIEIVGSGANQIPIAIAPFKDESGLPQSITAVVAADLQRSGLFKLVDSGGLTAILVEPQQVDYALWKTRGADALAIGAVAPLPDGRYDVRFRLMDILKQQQLAGFAYQVSAQQLRATAHRIADAIYEALTGDTGMFSTRIAYVLKVGNRYELRVADADGYGPRTVLASNDSIMSPAWSPDGTRIAYVSFEHKKAIVYLQSLESGARSVIANYKGSNSAPAWSPDGRRLAVVLSKDGSSQIYLVNPDGTGLIRVSSGSAIDTEPSFSPDGQSLLFTSDRGGSPQIYRMPVSGGAAARLTFEGSYNVTPRFAPDGKSFTFLQRNGNHFSIATQDFISGQSQLLTEGTLDESPCFSPNGRVILYATNDGGRGILATVSSDGRVRQRITVEAGDVQEPAWGPLVKP
ncbi:MAG TPA: Tol-Pal system beta propeller repeat protein TolB [Burkholderiales bacterium]|nr:Tol-Pal system beta propeller repeat protein TolB [Burkholderiales bacterium]